MKRRMRTSCSIMLASCLWACLSARWPSVASAQPLGREAFAYSIELEVTPGLPVQTVLVPLAVYRAALRPDLGDVRIFNARGDLLPHAIRKLDEPAELEQAVEQRELHVPLFPLLAPADAPAAALEQLALRIERGPSGSILDIKSGAAPTDAGVPAVTRVVAYVLDTQAVDRDMLSLRLHMTERPEHATESYLVPVVIDASDDLANWRSLVVDGVLARLAHEGQLVTRDRIDLGAARARFLRVRPLAGVHLPGPIHDAWVELAPSRAPARAREALQVSGVPSASERGVYDYDLGGAFPVERMRLILPSTGTLVRAEISVATAANENEPTAKTSAIRARTKKRIYDDVYEGTFYRLSQGGRELQSPAIELDGHRIRYVSVTVDQSATLDAPPQLEIEYLPAQLLFVPRDPGPFELAYGSYAAGPSTIGVEALLAPLEPASRKRLPASSVVLGAVTTISGGSALEPPPAPPPIRTYVLWAVLIAGTLAVTALAVRLIRKLD